MDKLTDLPVKSDTVKTKDESEIMDQLFPRGARSEGSSAPRAGEAPAADSTQASMRSKLNLKMIGLASLLFVALANPWIDNLFCKLPYCGDNALAVMGVKVLIFIIVLVIINLFC